MHRLALIFVTFVSLLPNSANWAADEPSRPAREDCRPAIESSSSHTPVTLSHRLREREAECCDECRSFGVGRDLLLPRLGLRATVSVEGLIDRSRRVVAHLQLCASAKRERSGVFVV